MNGNLNSALSTPMKHISDVHKCFSFCENEDDIDEVIDMNEMTSGMRDTVSVKEVE